MIVLGSNLNMFGFTYIPRFEVFKSLHDLIKKSLKKDLEKKNSVMEFSTFDLVELRIRSM